MSLINLPKMLLSESDGWSDLLSIHPSVARLYAGFIAPMSLVPPLMYAYAELAHPGTILPAVTPALSVGELFLWGSALFVIELAMVALMANYIQQIGNSVDLTLSFERASLLAATALTPLWLASLALLIPDVRANLAVLLLAWLAGALLIRHGIRPMFQLDDERLSHRLATEVTVSSVLAGLVMLLLFASLLSTILGVHRIAA
jgi:hypothetical protein